MEVVELSLILHCLALIRSGGHDDRCINHTTTSQVDNRFASNTDLLPQCSWPSSETPGLNGAESVNVHRLRLEAIRVLAACGDSITAALFARSIFILPLSEFREDSFAAGSAGDIFSLGNMLNQFSDKLVVHKEKDEDRQQSLNVAVSGAKARDLIRQVESLVGNIRSRDDINFDMDWKLVTVMVGNNDLCQICEENGEYDDIIGRMIGDVESALDFLQDHLPRTVVNLLPSLDFRLSFDVDRNFLCRKFYEIICPCVSRVLSPSFAIELQRRFHGRLQMLAASQRYLEDDQFTVVLQPFSGSPALDRHPTTGKIYRMFLAPDCFHPSHLAHEVMAKMLWNNMITPVGRKSTNGSDIEIGIKCPDPSVPYFPTMKNEHLWNPLLY